MTNGECRTNDESQIPKRSALEFVIRHSCPSFPSSVQARKEIFEQRVVKSTALRVILHSEGKRMFAQAHLLNNTVMRGPGFHFQIIAEAVNRLMMCAIHF